jgi:hypothetical protein
MSKTEFNRHKDNVIHVEGPYFSTDRKELFYHNIDFGKNLKLHSTFTNNNGMRIRHKSILIQKTKKRYVFITANKEECISMFPELLVSSSTTNTDPSGKVLLMACCLDNGKSYRCNRWDKDDFKSIKSCKPNILSASSHHGSVGYYASFGNKGSFDKTVDSSVGQYVTKKHKNNNRQNSINTLASSYEQKIATVIDSTVRCMDKLLPNIRSIISPCIDTAYQLQNGTKDINLMKVSSSNNGCWQSSICINAETKSFHNEHDCTYTLIAIPDQDFFNTKSKDEEYNFIFKLSPDNMVHIDLIAGISFIFSGHFLTHRQSKKCCDESLNSVFYNIASYGNKRLFNHLRKSINRI